MDSHSEKGSVRKRVSYGRSIRNLFVAVFLGCSSTGRVDLWFCGSMSRNTQGSTGSCSGFKASQKTGNSLKSHQTDWEKPGIEPANPGLQDIGLSPTPFVAFLGINQFRQVGLRNVLVL